MIVVHHLDCCTMCPVGGNLMGDGRMVAHCLLLETEQSGLVLVDTGIGLGDVADPPRMGKVFTTLFRPQPDEAQTAVRQVASRGFNPADVRHIVLTHLDVDHAGGLADFPGATVHVHADEQAAAMNPRSFNEKNRYRPVQWAHGPDWAPYRANQGEPWFGFETARELPGLPPEIVAIPLPGHTRGHAAVAVQTGESWQVLAGDAYFHRATVTGSPDRPPAGLRVFEFQVAERRRLLKSNHERLRELAGTDGVTVFCAHDPAEFAALA